MVPPPLPDRFDLRARRYTSERVGLYNQANHFLPQARETERNLLIQRLRLRPGQAVCDVAAGGGYLAEGIRDWLAGEVEIFCVENSTAFAATLGGEFHPVVSPLGAIALPDASMDRVACLAGLHHLERKADFFREALRLLKPGGILGVADVLDGTPPARFLNGPVDRYSDLGHDGMFFEPGQLTALMSGAGFEVLEETAETFFWRFADEDQMTTFCRSLFRMVKADPDEIRREIHRLLPVAVDDRGVALGWSLVYATARKPEAANPSP